MRINLHATRCEKRGEILSTFGAVGELYVE
jgi:hypothetical protein